MKINIFDQIKEFTPEKKAIKSKVTHVSFFVPSNYFPSADLGFKFDSSTRFWRLMVLIFITFLSFLWLAGKAFILQVIQTDYSQNLSDKNVVRQLLLQPERGVIYDKDRQYIVRNKPAFSLDLSPNSCSFGNGDYSLCTRVVESLSAVVSIDTDRVSKELLAGKSPILCPR